METKLEERLLLVNVELAEDLRSVEQMGVLNDPGGAVSENSKMEHVRPTS